MTDPWGGTFLGWSFSFGAGTPSLEYPNYTTLVADGETPGSILFMVNYEDLSPQSIVTKAEQWIYQRLRSREMLGEATGTLAAGQSSLTISTILGTTLYRAPKYLEFVGPRRGFPKMATLQQVRQARGYDANGGLTTGMPQLYHVTASTLEFERKADQDYSFSFWHYQALPPLSQTDKNFLTDRFFPLLEAVCKMFAYMDMKDDAKTQLWMTAAMAELRAAQFEDDYNQMPADELVMVPE